MKRIMLFVGEISFVVERVTKQERIPLDECFLVWVRRRCNNCVSINILPGMTLQTDQ